MCFLFQSSSLPPINSRRWQGIKFVSSETNGRPGLSFHFFSSSFGQSHISFHPLYNLFTQSSSENHYWAGDKAPPFPPFPPILFMGFGKKVVIQRQILSNFYCPRLSLLFFSYSNFPFSTMSSHFPFSPLLFLYFLFPPPTFLTFDPFVPWIWGESRKLGVGRICVAGGALIPGARVSNGNIWRHYRTPLIQPSGETRVALCNAGS